MGYSISNGFDLKFLQKIDGDAKAVKRMISELESYIKTIDKDYIQDVFTEFLGKEQQMSFGNIEDYYRDAYNPNDTEVDFAWEATIETLENQVAKFISNISGFAVSDLSKLTNNYENSEYQEPFLTAPYQDGVTDSLAGDIQYSLSVFSYDLGDDDGVLAEYKVIASQLSDYIDAFNTLLGAANKKDVSRVVSEARKVDREVESFFDDREFQKLAADAGVNLYVITAPLVPMSNYYDKNIQELIDLNLIQDSAFEDKALEYYGFIVGTLVDIISEFKNLKIELTG